MGSCVGGGRGETGDAALNFLFDREGEGSGSLRSMDRIWFAVRCS